MGQLCQARGVRVTLPSARIFNGVHMDDMETEVLSGGETLRLHGGLLLMEDLESPGGWPHLLVSEERYGGSYGGQLSRLLDLLLRDRRDEDLATLVGLLSRALRAQWTPGREQTFLARFVATKEGMMDLNLVTPVARADHEGWIIQAFRFGSRSRILFRVLEPGKGWTLPIHGQASWRNNNLPILPAELMRRFVPQLLEADIILPKTSLSENGKVPYLSEGTFRTFFEFDRTERSGSSYPAFYAQGLWKTLDVSKDADGTEKAPRIVWTDEGGRHLANGLRIWRPSVDAADVWPGRAGGDHLGIRIEADGQSLLVRLRDWGSGPELVPAEAAERINGHRVGGRPLLPRRAEMLRVVEAEAGCQIAAPSLPEFGLIRDKCGVLQVPAPERLLDSGVGYHLTSKRLLVFAPDGALVADAALSNRRLVVEGPIFHRRPGEEKAEPEDASLHALAEVCAAAGLSFPPNGFGRSQYKWDGLAPRYQKLGWSFPSGVPFRSIRPDFPALTFESPEVQEYVVRVQDQSGTVLPTEGRAQQHATNTQVFAVHLRVRRNDYVHDIYHVYIDRDDRLRVRPHVRGSGTAPHFLAGALADLGQRLGRRFSPEISHVLPVTLDEQGLPVPLALEHPARSGKLTTPLGTWMASRLGWCSETWTLWAAGEKRKGLAAAEGLTTATPSLRVFLDTGFSAAEVAETWDMVQTALKASLPVAPRAEVTVRPTGADLASDAPNAAQEADGLSCPPTP